MTQRRSVVVVVAIRREVGGIRTGTHSFSPARCSPASSVTTACEPIDPRLEFAGTVQDLHEIRGNVLDDACKWARHEVRIRAEATRDGDARRLRIVIDDDGPGIDARRRDAEMARGARLDESVPGSGLGLAIVNALVGLYGGSVTLGSAPAGGLRVELALPAG